MGVESVLGQAVVPIRASLKDLDSDLKGVQKKIEDALGPVAGKVTNSLAKIGTGLAVGGIAAAGAAITGVSAALLKLGKDALPIAGLRDAFQGITGDAAGMLRTLREGSLGMVRDADLMASYNSAAQLVGKTFADQLPGAMSYLSKVSAATGQDMGFMIDSLVKGVGRLSPMILDNLGIQVNLTEANEAYAASIGKDVKELTKQEQQTAIMNMAMLKLKENTAAMPEVAGTAAQQWAAFGVTVGNIKDRIGLAVLPILRMLAMALSDIFSNPAVQAGIDAIVEGIGVLYEKLETIIYAIRDGDIQGALAAAFGPELAGRIYAIAQAIGTFVSQVVTFVSAHAEEFKGALIAIGAIIAAATIVTGVIAIAGAIAALANPVTLVIVAVGLLGAAWAGNWGGIQDKTKAVIDWIMPFISGALAAIRGWWDAHGEQVMATVRGLWDGARGAFDAGVTFVKDLIASALAIIRSWWDAHGAAVLRVVANTWDSIKTAFNAAITILKDVVDLFLSVIRGDWSQAKADLLDIVRTLWNTIKTLFRNAVDSLRTITGELVQAVKAKWQSIDWGQIGRDVISGIGAGIMGAVGGLAQRAADAARAALDAARRALGISSPSRLAMLQIGVPFAEGIALGFDRAMPDLSALVARRMGALTLDARATIDRGAGTGATSNTTYNIYPSYRVTESEGGLRSTIRSLQMAGA